MVRVSYGNVLNKFLISELGEEIYVLALTVLFDDALQALLRWVNYLLLLLLSAKDRPCKNDSPP